MTDEVQTGIVADAEVDEMEAELDALESTEDNVQAAVPTSVKIVVAGGAVHYASYTSGLTVAAALDSVGLTRDTRVQAWVDGVRVEDASEVSPGSTITMVGNVKGG